MWSGRDLLLKVILPLCLVGLALYGMMTGVKLDSAEIPIPDNDFAMNDDMKNNQMFYDRVKMRLKISG